MDHSGIDRSCDRTVYLLRIQKPVKYFTTRADIPFHIVDIREFRITYMMIDADCFLCMVKSSTCNCQAVTRTDITGNKQIKFSAFFYFCLNISDTVYMTKDWFRMIQIYTDIYIRKIIPDIEIQRHTGTNAVTVRSDMSADTYCFNIFQYF